MDVDFIDVGSLLMHKPPMMLLSKLSDVSENGVRCEVQIRETDLFYTPDGVPAYVAIEYMAQTIGVFDGWSRRSLMHPPRIGYLVGTKELSLNCDFFTLGQRLLVEALLIWDGEKLLQFKCTTTDMETLELVASATLNVYSPSREHSEGDL